MIKVFNNNFKNLSINIKSTLWVIISTGIHSLFQWLLISMITKIYGVESVGLYSWTNALIIPIITLLGFNLRAVQLTDIDNKYSISDFLIIRLISSVFTSAVVYFVLIIRGSSSIDLIFATIILVSRISEIFSETFQSEFIKEGLFRRYGVSFIIRSVSSFSIFLLVSFITGNYLISLTAYSLMWVIILIYYDTRITKISIISKGYVFNPKIIIEIVSISLPLAIVASINTLYSSIPKYYVEYYMDMESLGVFSATSYVSLIGGLFVSGITLTFSPKLAAMFKRGEIARFVKILIVQQFLVILFSVIMYILFAHFGNSILPLIYTEEFVKYLDVILLLIIAMSLSFTARVLGTACTSIRLNKQQLFTALLCVLIIAISGNVLVPKYGLYGAANSMIIAYAIKNIILLFLLIIRITKLSN